jgi:hypothetical protein
MNAVRLAGLVPLAGAVLVLAACDKAEVKAENESAESVARKVADAQIRLEPGRWESTMTLEKIEIGNLPAEAQAAMNEQKGKAQTFSTCLTPEQAAKPDASFFQNGAAGCTYDHFTMAGGQIDAEMTCKPGSGPTHMTMQGTYGSDQYSMRMQSEGEMQPGVPMKMAMSIASRRTGDCTGKES